MMAVPGRPKSMEKAPNKSTRMKMVSPPVSRGDNYFFLFSPVGLILSKKSTIGLAMKTVE